MKKTKDSSEGQPEAQSDEAKNFQNLIDKVLSVPKAEIDKREAEYKKTKGK